MARKDGKMEQKQSPLRNNNPKHELTESEVRKGGIKSGESRRKNKTFAESTNKTKPEKVFYLRRQTDV